MSLTFKRIQENILLVIISACGCDDTGSSNSECTDSGVCTCEDGYKGAKCDADCGCDTVGSSSKVCDQFTGACTCNENYSGQTCPSSMFPLNISTCIIFNQDCLFS